MASHRANPADGGGYGRPRALSPNVGLQIEPKIERHSDGVADPPSTQPPQHILAKKGRIHAKPDAAEPRDGRDERLPELAQKRQARLPVVHVPGPVLDAQNVGRLGHVRQDRVVTGHLPMMRIETAEGARDLQPRRDHDAVHINRDGAEPERGQHASDDAGVEILQAADGGHRERFQPATHRPRHRQPAEPREAAHQRIVGEVRDMPQPTPADHHEGDQQAHHRGDAVVAAQRRAPEHVANHRVEACATQIPPEQLEPCVRCQGHIAEGQCEITIDTGRQIEFPLSHRLRPFVRGRTGWVAPPFNHSERPFSIQQTTYKLHF